MLIEQLRQSYWLFVLAGVVGFFSAIAIRRLPAIKRFVQSAPSTWSGVLLLGIIGSLIASLLLASGAALLSTFMSVAFRQPLGTPWALVQADGTTYGAGVSTSNSKQGAAGRYAVTFNQDISSCFYSGTVGDPSDRVPTPALIALSPSGSGALDVTLFDKSGQPADQNFYVQADCTQKRPSAIVNADGSSIRGVGVSTTRRTGLGTYDVEVAASVTLCEFNATAYAPAGSNPVPAVITLQRSGPHIVNVDIVNLAGVHVDSGFSISLDCAPNGLWGYVSDDGSIARGTGFGDQSPDHSNVGQYEVTFDKPIGWCAFSANVLTPFDPKAPPAVIYASIGRADSVYVDITDASGQHVDRSFYLNVSCQDPG